MRFHPWVLAAGLVLSAHPVLAQTPKAKTAKAPTPKAAAPKAAEAPKPPEPKSFVPPGMGFPLGSTAAKVEVVQFSDLGCDSCATYMIQTWPKFDTEFITPKLVRWVFVPIRVKPNVQADAAVIATICADPEQNAWGMILTLFNKQKDWIADTVRVPSYEFEYGMWVLHLDQKKFKACMTAQPPKDRMKKISAYAESVGIKEPTFFINGVKVEGALPPVYFDQAIAFELQRASPK